MKILEPKYIGSFPSEAQCPSPAMPEYAFIGRSNVGKSSLINILCDRKEIAKVSKTPGKTQTLNYYNIDDSWYIVDLPGYGYAKISRSQRKNWEHMIETYLTQRQTLQCAFVLIDSRHDLQKIDSDFMNWLGEMNIPFVIVYTKTDKLKKQSEAKRNIERIQKSILETWEELPRQFETSSVTRLGRKDILDFIAELNENAKQ